MNKNVRKNLKTIKTMYKPRDEEEEKGPGLLSETTREKVVRKQKERKERQKGRRRQLKRQAEQGRDDKIAKASLKNPIVVKSRKVTPLQSQNKTKKPIDKAANRVSKKDKKEGSEFKAYPGAAGRAGFEYGRDTAEILDDKNISEEIKERIEEAELYEGDFMGGRVGKGKKKKVSEAPRGVRAALRGFKPKIGVGKGNKRTRGTGGGWV